MRFTRIGDDLIKPAIRRAATDLRTVTVGVVEQFIRGPVSARIKTLIQTVTVNGAVVDDNPCPSAIVITPRGDGYGVFFDCAAGDPGILVASDRPWAGSWKTGNPSLPDHSDGHSYGSAAFLPGGHVGDAAPANAKGHMLIGAENRSAAVDFDRRSGKVTVNASAASASVRLGGASGSELAYQEQTNKVLADIITWIAAIQTVLVDPNLVPIDPLAVGLKAAGASQAPTVVQMFADLAAHIGTLKTVAE